MHSPGPDELKQQRRDHDSNPGCRHCKVILCQPGRSGSHDRRNERPYSEEEDEDRHRVAFFAPHDVNASDVGDLIGRARECCDVRGDAYIVQLEEKLLRHATSPSPAPAYFTPRRMPTGTLGNGGFAVAHAATAAFAASADRAMHRSSCVRSWEDNMRRLPLVVALL